MSGICGWLGTLSAGNTPENVLSEMSEAFYHTNSLTKRSIAHPDASVSLHSPNLRDRIYSDDRFLIAIDGDPYWDSEALTRSTHNEGLAKTILGVYLQSRISLLTQLRGAFSLALIDRKTQSALLAVDRMGRLPLCYTETENGGLVFSSTISAISRHPDTVSELSEQAIFDYLYFYMVPSPRTIYRDQKKLQPGEYLYFKNGVSTADFYWKPHFVDSTKSTIDNLQEEFRTILEASVRRNTCEGEIGAFLSGGLDSSTVSGMLAKVSNKTAKTFSIGFDAKGYDEIEFSRIAAKRFNTTPHEYYVTPEDVVSAIPLIAKAYDEPYGNSSAVPTYFCAQLAKENGIKILLAGDGGDELFAGNTRYAKQRIFEIYSIIPSILRNSLIEPIILPLPAKGKNNPLRKLQSYINQAKIPLPERLESYNLLHMVPLTEIFSEDFLLRINMQQPVQHLREVYGRALTTSSLNRMLYLDWKITLADNDLRKVNNMCALSGVEVKYPLLDDELVEFSTRLPPDLKLRGSKLRYFFKQSLMDFLPREIINKPKHGFGLPFGVWLHESPKLQELANDSISSFKKRGYVRPDYLDHLTDLHRNEHAAFYGEMLWPLMILELWLQTHGH